MIEVRREQRHEQEAIRQLNLAAFEGTEEATVVDLLRSSCEDYLSFVAVEEGSVVGHVLFTPVTVDGSETIGMGLAPMAVAPARQRSGIGTRLVRHGLEHLRSKGCPFVIVLGHPAYYPRFGFQPASTYQLTSQWNGIPDEAFMAVVFDASALPNGGGVVRYRQEFDAAV